MRSRVRAVPPRVALAAGAVGAVVVVLLAGALMGGWRPFTAEPDVLKPGHFDAMFETELGFRLLLIGGVMLAFGLMAIRGLLKSALKD